MVNDKIRTAVIIAGGEGSRLYPLTKNKPKTLVEVNGKPVLYWIIKRLVSAGITHVVLGVAYKKEKVYEFMEKNKNFGVKVDFSVHTVEGGTAEGFRLAISRFVRDKNFLAMNSDELNNMNLSKFMNKHEKFKTCVTMAVSPFPCRFSIVKFDKYGKINEFEYGKKVYAIPVSIGIYAFNIKILKYIPNKGSIETSVFEKLARKGQIGGYMLSKNEEWYSINTLKDIKEANENAKNWSHDKTNKNRPYWWTYK